MSTTQIDINELEELKRKANLFDALDLDESLIIAQNITNNAINVNKASKTRLSEIENIEQLVNDFINQSNEIKDMSGESLDSAKLTSDESSETIKLVEELFELVNHMSSSIEEFARTIEDLNEKNQSITDLVQVNGKISMQTNLLAINAAIEASKAKEYGRGFAIVAGEVKKLAAASKQSTADIGNEVDRITIMTNEVIKKNEAVQELVGSSVKVSKEAIDKLQKLINVAHNNSQNSDNISSNVCRQLKNSDTIKEKISKLIEDTKKAIEGSSTNIGLGETLVGNLQDK